MNEHSSGLRNHVRFENHSESNSTKGPKKYLNSIKHEAQDLEENKSKHRRIGRKSTKCMFKYY